METGAGFPKPAPFSLSLIGEVYSFAFFGAYGDRLFHLSVLFVHGFNYVGPRRKPLYCKRSVVARHGEEGVSDHANVRAHPGVYVALHRDHDLLPVEALGQGRLSRRLRLVPIGVHLRLRVDVVVGGVAGLELEVLGRDRPGGGRLIHAAVLVQADLYVGYGPLLVGGESGFHPDEGILQGTVVVDYHFFAFLRRSFVGTLARGVGRHVERRHLGFLAGERHLPGDGATVGFVGHGQGTAGRGRGGRLRFGGLRRFIATASRQ